MHPQLFVHIPAHRFNDQLSFLLERGLQPEVACQEVEIGQLDLAQIADAANQLADKGLKTCLHAPFFDFNPGSKKSRDQKTAHRMCQDSLRLAETLRAQKIVFHPGIPYQASPKQQSRWLEQSLIFWSDYRAQAEELETVICIENIYETGPEIFQPLFAELANEHFGHCFDIGHWNMFANQPLEHWFATLGPYISHLHLHDNHGSQDEHLPIGAGQIDFELLFAQLKTLPRVPTKTLEAHRQVDLESSLRAISSHL